MGSSIAAMPAMCVDARHAKRQVYQPGLNPLFEGKVIIASTNPEFPDAFEYNRNASLHGYTPTELQGYIATHREEHGNHFVVQTFGAITPGAPALNSVRSAEVETSQFEQSSIKERQLEKA